MPTFRYVETRSEQLVVCERNDGASVEKVRSTRRRNRRKHRSRSREDEEGEGKQEMGVTEGRIVQEEENIERWKLFRTRSRSIGQAN